MAHMATTHPGAQQSLAQLLKGTWADRLLLLLALIGIMIAWLLIQAAIASGPALAEIYRGGTLLATYPLPQKGEPAIRFEVEGKLGISVIVLDERGARITASPCASQRCVLSGNHRHAGDLIACVPNRVLVTLRGSAKSRFDAIVE